VQQRGAADSLERSFSQDIDEGIELHRRGDDESLTAIDASEAHRHRHRTPPQAN